MTLQKGIKKILLILIITITIFIAGIIVFHLYIIPMMITIELKHIQCNGTIISMNESSPCFVTVEVKQQNDTARLDVNYCGPEYDFFKFAAVGDSITKQDGQLLITVKKKGSYIQKTFDYPYSID